MSDPAPLLSVTKLRTTLTTPGGPLVAVADVDLTLERGQSLGIVGESGSGKSMLVRSIMGIAPSAATVHPDSRIVFDGRDVTRLDRKQARHFWGTEIAMIFQDPLTSLNPVRTIASQITDPLRFHLGLSRKQARARALELLDMVRIPSAASRLDEYPHQLSGGMRQRIGIAIALACDPTLLIADEPTTALDVTVQYEILELLQSIQTERKMAMILVSHDLGVVSRYTDRIGVMYAGRLIETSATAGLRGQARHPYTEALLASIPRTDLPPHTRLQAIDGRPPDLLHLEPGCRFAPRCGYVRDRCRTDEPLLHHDDRREHPAACHFPLDSSTTELIGAH
ncbi:ABC transporter ATP-binding protein [Rhodococcus sp. NPDC058514]|uniref:ABC transporter ATP-binding protein n=1 Tax=unclassified Rhodococcus (in: high G+C Gram-positive bacteria) TaxID=192944 RepID=UPI0036487EB9